MQGNPQVKIALQMQLKNELTAINQYYMHYRILKHWGFEKLSKLEFKESIKKMKHADYLMDRILILDGLPNLQDLGKLLIGEDTPEVIKCDLTLEKNSQRCLLDGIKIAEIETDFVSRDLFLGLLDETEEQIDFLETQENLIKETGLENYLESQIAEDVLKE